MYSRLPTFAPRTIRAKVAIGAAVVALVLIALVATVLLESVRSDFARVLAAQQDALAAEAAGELDEKLAQDRDIVRRSAEVLTTDALRSADELRAHLARDPALLALFDDVVVLDATGRVLADMPPVPGRTDASASDRAFFRQVMSTGEPVISEPLLSKHRKEPVINMAAPVKDAAGRTVGVLVGVLRLDKPNLLGSLASEQIGRTGYFTVITKDPDPVYVIHPDRSRILQPRSRYAPMRATADALNGAEQTVESVNSEGVRALFSYRTLKTTNWLLIAVLPSAEAFAPIAAAERRLLVSATVFGFLVAGLVWLMIDRLLAPLTHLRDHMRAMRTLASALPAPVERQDEIGDLAMAFNQLMDERASAMDALERRSRDLRLASKVFESTADAVIVSDADDRVIMVNPAFTRMTGFNERDMVGKALADSPFRPIDPRQSAARMAVQREKGFVTAEVLRYRKDGSELPLWVTASNVTDDEGRVTHHVRVFTDISHLKESQRRLEALAASDPLTGVHNRRAFDDALHAALRRYRADGVGFAVLFLDLDAFKDVNDSLGHERGDELLTMVASRLQSCVRAGDLLCRLGGDEFGVLLDAEHAQPDAQRIAERMLAACTQPFALGEHTATISASIGIALCPRDGIDVPSLMRSADAAMYAAKRAGGARVETGVPSLAA